MGPGDGFGEIALLRRCPRTATVRARTDLSLYRLDRGPFLTTVGAATPRASSSAEQLVDDRLTTFKPPRHGVAASRTKGLGAVVAGRRVGANDRESILIASASFNRDASSRTSGATQS